MTSFVEPPVGAITPYVGDNSLERTHKDHHFRHVLRSKENTHKRRCNRELKKKLKKYKLRPDGGEDEDILDVSKILVNSLMIKSPISDKDSQKIEELREFDELRPKNYLFKMVRKKSGNNRIEYILNPKDEEDKNNHHVDNKVSQEKKQTNAFQLLMDSRNKSIGTNSPGKDKVDESDAEEALEKKNNKAKRQLLLQKMAESKGALKRKEMEEYQEACIKQKMKKRAENLKKMILNDQKPANKLKTETNRSKVNNQPLINNTVNGKSTPENVEKRNKKTFQIVDIFNVLSETTKVSPEQKPISDDDNEFLNKLSPSIKKKESMLSYFKKLDKEPETPVDDENHSPIKIKLGKAKKRGRKKLSLTKKNKEDIDDMAEKEEIKDITAQEVVLDTPGSEEVKESDKMDDRKKLRRTKTINNNNDSIGEQVSSESRPKRSVKRPIKYNDETYLTSSDEELHIFTPKKKKALEIATDDKSTKVVVTKVNSSNDTPKPKDKKPKVKNEPKKPVKLAPIFSKPAQTDPVALEAKQKFLQSGVPEKLKKMIKQQKISNILATDFPVVVHVQQVDQKPIEPNAIKCMLPEDNSDDDDTSALKPEIEYSKLLDLSKEPNIIQIDSNSRISVQVLLQDLKHLYPKFPVYRTYRYLRSKRKGELVDFNCANFDNSIEVLNGDLESSSESPEKLNWTNKYKALSTNQIIGNFETVKELKKWLVSWTENEIKSKAKTNLDSDSSDYYQSDTDSRDSVKSMNNLLILTGPTGSGKTSCIYAVAAELAIKVIEVNVSSKRTGKIMLQDLQEATQSHKVNRGKGLDNSQKSQDKPQVETKNVKRKGRPKKLVEKNVNSKKVASKASDSLSGTTSSQDSVRTCMSLILIDDADIVFEQDDGFSSAIMQLVQSSKRPVILVTSSLVCPHLQRFVQYGKIMRMYPLIPRMLGTWLDIMCLADNSMCWPGLGAKFLNHFKGDIRKTINYLQFYTSLYVSNSDEEVASQNIDNFKVNVDDENSCMSWADHESEAKHTVESNTNGISTILADFERQSDLSTCTNQLELFNVWWSIPHLLERAPSETNSVQTKKSTDFKSLEVTASAIDAISLADLYNHKRPTSYNDITADPWFSCEMDSVSELENLDYYHRGHGIGDEISHELVTGSVVRAQKELCCASKTSLQAPGMMLQRQRNKIVSRHNSLTTYLNPWTALDRRAVALDYWPACRSICRIEKDKTDHNSKRNNRFCHYLKSLSVLCKSETFDKLGDSLCCE